MNELDLFAAALAIPDPAARSAYLDRACAGSPDLRRRLDDLLAGYARAGNPLDRPIVDPAAVAPTADDPGPVPRAADPDPPAATAEYPRGGEVGLVIAGRYTLLERIGEGGMGEVWVARQTEPVQRKVAVKLIKAGMDSKAVLARFEAERQALALMDHPNIARVLDGGLTDRGRPYFVMELVNGLPLTRFCDEAKLTPRERLELFVPVCQAVQHAHQKGVVHRDLKPSNVLVTLYDGRPVPKVIDFGVAKAAGGKLTEHTISTGFGAVVGTLEYMAPEQAGFSAVDVDTRADVYSLGVILYELLTGLRPFDSKRLHAAAIDEVLRIIREEMPPRPSTKLSSDGSLPSLAAVRQTEPKRLTALMRGELDWVVMKALEKDRSRRYETANALSRDVQRYLADEPVEARPPTSRYRLRKFVRRNRPQVIAASLVLLALLAGIVGTTFGLIRATRAAEREADERWKADAARAEAQAKEAEANAVAKFFEDKVFAAGRPIGDEGGLGHDVSLRDAVRVSLPALGSSFKDHPLVEARLRNTLGATFRYLGDPAQAVTHLERARALFAHHRGPDHPDTLGSMDNLAVSYLDLNRPAEASKLYEKTLAARMQVLGPDHPDTLTSMSGLAMSYHLLDRHAEALKLHEATLAARRRVLGPDNPDTFWSMNGLARTYAALSRPDEALKLHGETLAARTRVLGPDNRYTLESMYNLAYSYSVLKRHAEALKLYEDTLAVMKRVLPLDHRHTRFAMNNLARTYAALGRHAEALKLYEDTLAERRRMLPPDHPATLDSMYDLADRYAALGRHAEALELREETLAARKRVLGPDHPLTLGSMNNLALSYAALGRHEVALKVHEETLAARRRVLPPDHPDTLWSLANLANSYVALNHPSEALPLLDEVLAKANRPGVDPGWDSFALAVRAQCYQKLGDLANCRATAEMLEKLNRTDRDSLYNAACCRALTASLQAKVKDPDAARLAREDADRAMAWLHKAVAAGWADAAQMRKDIDLDSLRDRADFKQLLVDLKAKSPPPPEQAPPPLPAR